MVVGSLAEEEAKPRIEGGLAFSPVFLFLGTVYLHF